MAGDKSPVSQKMSNHYCTFHCNSLSKVRDGAIKKFRSNFDKLLITITNFHRNENEEFMLFGNDNDTEIELPERSQ